MVTKKGYKIVIPDKAYYRKIFNCYDACPVHTRAGNYVTAIAEGKYEDAYKIASDPNPFVNVCGRVCGHPCETACRRGKIDNPVSIRALKRFVCESHRTDSKKTTLKNTIKPNGKKVAVLGAGPAGLSAAHDLALMGYSVTLYEMMSQVGGMLCMGLPKYRLPREIIKDEVDLILELGVDVRTNSAIGKDYSLADLKEQGFEAVFISVGADKGRGVNIEGNDLDGVLNGIDFLLNVNLGYKVELGKKVIIVGGGNVAIDVARSVVREITDIDKLSHDELKSALKTAKSVLNQIEEVHEINRDELTVALDVARSALRISKDIDVKMICLESKEEMPAHKNEIEEALLEGITILPSIGPRKIHGKDGVVTGLETIDVKSVFDENGRFNPVFYEGTNKVIEADTVVLAIGQTTDLSFILPEDRIETTKRGTIAVDPETLATTAPWVFAGGDVAFGPRLIINAVADGKKAAQSIHRYLSQEKSCEEKPVNMQLKESHKMYDGFDTILRQEPPTLPIDRRIGVDEVELSYSKDIAEKEARRCLKCDINTIFDSSKCILCAGCVDVCPEYCLKLVNLDNMYDEDADLDVLVEKVYGISMKEFKASAGELNEIGTAIIKDEDKCIRCGLCAQRCPVKAITMEQLIFE